MAAQNERSAPPQETNPAEYLAVGLAWVIPGAGHLVIGQKARGTIFLVTIHLLFALGLFVGGLRAIRPEDQPIWSYAQFMAGWPMVASSTLQRQQVALSKDAPRLHDVGAVYCGIAGMLNLLVMFDLMMRIGHGGQRPTDHLHPDAQPAPEHNGGKPS